MPRVGSNPGLGGPERMLPLVSWGSWSMLLRTPKSLSPPWTILRIRTSPTVIASLVSGSCWVFATLTRCARASSVGSLLTKAPPCWVTQRRYVQRTSMVPAATRTRATAATARPPPVCGSGSLALTEKNRKAMNPQGIAVAARLDRRENRREDEPEEWGGRCGHQRREPDSPPGALASPGHPESKGAEDGRERKKVEQEHKDEDDLGPSSVGAGAGPRRVPA